MQDNFPPAFGIPEFLMVELAACIRLFQERGQYDVLSGVSVGELFRDLDSTPQILMQLSFEDLLRIDPKVLESHDEVLKAHIEELITILTQLTPPLDGTSNSLDTGEGTVETFLTSTGSPRAIDIPEFNSVEAERLLVERYDMLRNSPIFEEVKQTKVIDYWDQSIVRDPFMEMLTFRQLLEISVNHLLQKKTFTNAKIFCLIKAFDLFFEEKGV